MCFLDNNFLKEYAINESSIMSFLKLIIPSSKSFSSILCSFSRSLFLNKSKIVVNILSRFLKSKVEIKGSILFCLGFFWKFVAVRLLN
jgi:hypothetical protein